MRISDWSSDVCSSDLAEYDKLFKETYDGYTTVPYQAAQASAAVIVYKEAFEKANSFDTEVVRDALAALEMETFYGRSEEHTSELQSLMRISYAVFCLKKKTNTRIHRSIVT